MKIYHYLGIQLGIGFAVWPSGAEIFIGPLMLRVMFLNKRIESQIDKLTRIFRLGARNNADKN